MITGHRGSTVQFWDVSTGKEGRKLTCEGLGSAGALAASPDGRLVATAENSLQESRFAVWDLAGKSPHRWYPWVKASASAR